MRKLFVLITEKVKVDHTGYKRELRQATIQCMPVQKTIQAIHSCRITCERSESARERRTALSKNDQQHIIGASTPNQYFMWVYLSSS